MTEQITSTVHETKSVGERFLDEALSDERFVPYTERASAIVDGLNFDPSDAKESAAYVSEYGRSLFDRIKALQVVGLATDYPEANVSYRVRQLKNDPENDPEEHRGLNAYTVKKFGSIDAGADIIRFQKFNTALDEENIEVVFWRELPDRGGKLTGKLEIRHYFNTVLPSKRGQRAGYYATSVNLTSVASSVDGREGIGLILSGNNDWKPGGTDSGGGGYISSSPKEALVNTISPLLIIEDVVAGLEAKAKTSEKSQN